MSDDELMMVGPMDEVVRRRKPGRRRGNGVLGPCMRVVVDDGERGQHSKVAGAYSDLIVFLSATFGRSALCGREFSSNSILLHCLNGTCNTR
jgi:hypothetical protein